MLRATAFTLVVAIVLPSVGAIDPGLLQPPNPLCDAILAEFELLGPCYVYHGEHTIEADETVTYVSRDTVVFAGRVTVEGVIGFYGARAFFTGDGNSLRIASGGELSSFDATFTGLDDDQEGIVGLDGSYVDLDTVALDDVPLTFYTDDAQVQMSTFSGDGDAITLVGSDASIFGNDFLDYDRSIVATGGSPVITTNQVNLGGTAITIGDAIDAYVDGNTLSNVERGIRWVDSGGQITYNTLDDKHDPGSHGIEVIDSLGPVDVKSNSISEFGVGLFVRNSNVDHDNTNSFVSNGVNIDEA